MQLADKLGRYCLSNGGFIVQIQFIGQPFSDQIGTLIKRFLEEATTSRFLVAWGKTSGLSRLSEELRQSVARGGRIHAIVGVDEAGASIEGLQDLIELTTHPYVFHNPKKPARTFHPKLYIFESQAETNIIVGSGNLTLGGLFRNYEAAAWVKVSATDSDEAKRFAAGAVKYFDTFQNDSNSCKSLSRQLIEEMRRDPTLVILPEGVARRLRLNVRRGPVGQRVFQASEVELLEGPGRLKRRLDEAGQPRGEESESIADELLGEVSDSIADELLGEVSDDIAKELDVTGFFKKLSRNDVSLSSSPGQIIIPIRFEDFFSPLETTQNEQPFGGPKKEERLISGTFSSGAEIVQFNGRVILYTPATNHPRQNREIRFTFRDRRILEKLAAGQYLRFVRVGDNPISVTQHVEAPGSADFGWLEHKLEYKSGIRDDALEGSSGNQGAH